jgi:hypothetical protein
MTNLHVAVSLIVDAVSDSFWVYPEALCKASLGFTGFIQLAAGFNPTSELEVFEAIRTLNDNKFSEQ